MKATYIMTIETPYPISYSQTARYRANCWFKWYKEDIENGIYTYEIDNNIDDATMCNSATKTISTEEYFIRKISLCQNPIVKFRTAKKFGKLVREYNRKNKQHNK